MKYTYLNTILGGSIYSPKASADLSETFKKHHGFGSVGCFDGFR